MEASIGVPLFQTDLEKVVRPGVRMPIEDGMIAVSPKFVKRLSQRSRGLVACIKQTPTLYWLRRR